MKQTMCEFVHGLTDKQACRRITELEQLARDMNYCRMHQRCKDCDVYRRVCGNGVCALQIEQRMALLGILEDNNDKEKTAITDDEWDHEIDELQATVDELTYDRNLLIDALVSIKREAINSTEDE